METAVIDPRNRFSISYVPRMSEHPIETGRTTAEAQFKVILLACEVERLAALNYTLVKENEVLRAHADKATREKDLEMKLAIVLAENEKLNQVIDEIANLHGGQLPTAGDADKRLSDLLRELERWKDENQVLRDDNQKLAEQLDTLKKSEVFPDEGAEARIPSRVENIKRAGAEPRGLAEEIARLRKEVEDKDAQIEDLKKALQSGADGDKIKELLDTNEKLAADNNTKARENQELKDKLDVAIRDNQDIADVLRAKSDEAKNLADENANLKKLVDQGAGADTVIPHLREQLNALLNQLNQTQDALAKKTREADDLRNQNNELAPKAKEADDLKKANAELTNENDRLRSSLQQTSGDRENLANQARGNTEKLLDELQNLQNLLAAKAREADDFKNKHALLTMENERLSKDNEDKNKENQALKDEVDRLRKLSEQTGGEKDVTIQNQKNEIDKLKEDLARKTQEADDFSHRVPLLTMENERLTNDNDQKQKDNDNLKRDNQAMFNDIEKLKKALADRDQIINSLKPQLENLVQELTRAQGALDAKNRENAELAKQNRDLIEIAKQHEDLKQKVGLLALENERLANALKDKLRESEEQKKRLKDLEAGSALIDKLNQQVKGLQDALIDKDKENAALKDAADRHKHWKDSWADTLGEIESGNRALGDKITGLLADIKEDK